MLLDQYAPRADDDAFQETVADALSLVAAHTGLDAWTLARRTEGEPVVIGAYGRAGGTDRLVPVPVPGGTGEPSVVVAVPGLDGAPLATLTGYGRPSPAVLDPAAPDTAAPDPAASPLPVVANMVGALLARELWWAVASRPGGAEPMDEALRDPVTGVGNRHWWDRVVDAEERRGGRYASPAVVVLVDLLDTARFNASFGRSAGDVRLREAARTLAAEVRQFDQVARVGSDEFGILLLEAGEAHADQIVSRLGRVLRAAGLAAAIGWAVRTPGTPLRAAWAAAEARLRRSPTTTTPRPPVTASLPPGPRPAVDDTDVAMRQVLDLVRRRLGMDAAFIAEFVGDQRVFRWVSTERPIAGVEPGAGDPREETYCQRIADGRLPRVVPDAAADPVTRALDITGRVGIGSYLGIPVILPGGREGTLCCFSRDADATLNERDAAYLSDAAELITATLGTASVGQRRRHEVLDRLETLQRAGGPEVVVQPIVDLRTGDVAGYEALSRFPAELGRSPLQWFTDAAEIGEVAALEASALRNTLATTEGLAGFLSVNLSPTAVLTPGTLHILARGRLDRLVLELTEQEHVDDLTEVAEALTPLRRRGLRVAIDDVGAGYAGLNRVAQLRPDLIKLDIGLVRGIERDEIRQALGHALISFAEGSGALVVAEGIETVGELATLRGLGAHLGQGWCLSRPTAPAAAPRHIPLPA